MFVASGSPGPGQVYERASRQPANLGTVEWTSEAVSQ
jgi:hypothetical protein